MAIGYKIGDVDYEGVIKERFNLVITREDFCRYQGHCTEHLNTSGSLCKYCTHRILLDIPAMIKSRTKKKK